MCMWNLQSIVEGQERRGVAELMAEVEALRGEVAELKKAVY